MTTTISIKGLNKDEVLAALFNGSRQQGMGFADKRGTDDMTTEQACAILDARTEQGGDFYFDYLLGWVMKVDLGEDDVDPWLYDRDVGQGAFEAVIEELRAKQISK